jgi:hypothetical protein
MLEVMGEAPVVKTQSVWSNLAKTGSGDEFRINNFIILVEVEFFAIIEKTEKQKNRKTEKQKNRI